MEKKGKMEVGREERMEEEGTKTGKRKRTKYGVKGQ